MTPGKALQLLRTARGWRPNDVAFHAPYSPGSPKLKSRDVCEVENGGRPPRHPIYLDLLAGFELPREVQPIRSGLVYPADLLAAFEILAERKAGWHQGMRLRLIRTAKGVDPKDLAEALGISRDSLYRLEVGEYPYPGELFEKAEAFLGCPGVLGEEYDPAEFWEVVG